MSHFKPVPLEFATRLINHGPTIMVTSRSADGSKKNVMTAAWSTLVEFEPPKLIVVINKGAYTRSLIEESGVFAICVPTVSILDKVNGIGNMTGREIDKFNRYHLETVQTPQLNLPVIEEGCVAWLECRLLSEPERYDICFGEIVSAAADTRVFQDGLWNFNERNRELHTIHHLGGGTFVPCGDMIFAKLL